VESVQKFSAGMTAPRTALHTAPHKMRTLHEALEVIFL